MEYILVMFSNLLALGSVIGGHLFGRNNIHLEPQIFLGKLLRRAFTAVILAAGSTYLGYTIRYAEESVAWSTFATIAACVVGYSLMAIISYEMRRKKPTQRPRF